MGYSCASNSRSSGDSNDELNDALSQRTIRDTVSGYNGRSSMYVLNRFSEVQ